MTLKLRNVAIHDEKLLACSYDHSRRGFAGPCLREDGFEFILYIALRTVHGEWPTGINGCKDCPAVFPFCHLALALKS